MDSQHPLALPPYMSPADFPSPFPGRARSSEICRDFNNRAGYCPRGHSCPFLHVFETHDPRFTYPLFAADPYMSGGDPFMRKKKPCRDFNSPSGCPRGGSCRFPHVKERESKRRKFVDVSAGEKVDEVCKDFNNFNGMCPRGESCPFQHIKEEKTESQQSRICRNYVKDGFCPRGDRCAFIHQRDSSSTTDDHSPPHTPHTRKEVTDSGSTNKSLQELNTTLREELTSMREELLVLRKENILLRKENAEFRRKLRGEHDSDDTNDYEEQADKKRKRDPDEDDEVL